MSKNNCSLFSDNLKRLMTLKNVTQSDLIKDLDIPSATISSWVNGLRTPRFEKLQLLADYFKVPVSELLKTPDEPDYIRLRNINRLLATTEDLLLLAYRTLNNAGKKEAVKRVQELTEIKKYTEPDRRQRNTTELNAAHELPNATDEDKKHYDNIMDDDEEW